MRVFEVCPAAEPHLDGPAAATLPLPSPARLVGTRYGIQGRVVGQLAEFAGPADALWGAWLAAGWQVEVREANATAAQHALCCKGSVRWHVWLWKNGRQPGIVLATRIA